MHHAIIDVRAQRCSGTRPSISVTDRLISAPPRRPERRILTPLAPRRMRLLNRVLHRAAICHTTSDLLGDALRDQACIGSGTLISSIFR